MTYMYIGPDIKGVARHNQIYTYKPDAVIARACEVHPLAMHLFVPMDTIVESKRELKREGSFLFIANEKIKKTRR